MTHDPLCPKTLHEYEHDDYTYYCDDRGKCESEYPCQCELIAKVRADERNRRNVARELTQLAQGMGMIP